MPWSESDYPNSMKNLHPKVRNKAIHIANAILESGGQEGTAIATGIKRAKGMGLIKAAAEKCQQYKHQIKFTHPKDPVHQVDEHGELKKNAALEGGVHSNLPNAWNTMGKGVGIGQRQDIPLAKGLPKTNLVKFAATKFQRIKNALSRATGIGDHSRELESIKSVVKRARNRGAKKDFLHGLIDESMEEVLSPSTAGKSAQELRAMAHKRIGALKNKLGR